MNYNVILESPEATVVGEYKPIGSRSDAYQSEAALEAAFIKQLVDQGYEYIAIAGSVELEANLRRQLERLNRIKFSDSEWKRFFRDSIAGANDGIEEKTRRIQEDNVQVLRRDDGTSKNITLIDKVSIHENSLQVINQYVPEGGARETRYDVTILVNGLPLVHIELKRRGVSIKEAFNQIERYQRDSFWADSGLFEYVQVFVISNGTHTKYYSNTTRWSAVKERTGRKNTTKTSNSFEFASFWADAANHIIPDLVDFTRTFFAKHTLLAILTRYCVFTSDKLLLVMRPYQIVATERILERIKLATNHRLAGTRAGGYIWHTTGSGKTLTSFKTAQLATKLEGVDKVLFVVDRKDLDYQTMREYDRFEKGAANGNRSTAILKRQLENRDAKNVVHEYKIVVTTIQKLDSFIKQNNTHEVYGRHVVLIFDECHRSQFGDMHLAITRHFKNCNIFGFTGTPIFAANAPANGSPFLKTTEQAFGDKLHTYTIVDAINDGNVLPFRIDYVNTVKAKDDIRDRQVPAIDRERALLAKPRLKAVVKYVLGHFDQKTRRDGGSYAFSKLTNIAEVARGLAEEKKLKTRLNGFNSIFAASSNEAARLYYEMFRDAMSKPGAKKLKVAMIYSYAANEAEDESAGLLDEESSDDTAGLDATSRDALDRAIADYNAMFNTAYDTSSARFPSYYKDVSLRMKNRELDLLIVDNMFLTGFDATTLNTLWTDKNLRMHGLIQAFSRTNRILNSVKTYGNIVCFRDLAKVTDEAVALFGDKEAGGIVILKSFKEYLDGWDDDKGHHKGYLEILQELRDKFPLGHEIVGERAEKEFIRLFGSLLRLRNILMSFDEFAEADPLAPRDFQDWTGVYNDLHDKYRGKDEKESINDDIVFEMELVRQVEVNIDYILALVAKYRASHEKDREVLGAIDRAVKSSPELRSKKALIDSFIADINVAGDVADAWERHVANEREKDLKVLISSERLKPAETRKLLANAIRDGELKTSGTGIDQILPPISRFGGGERATVKATVVGKLKEFFSKYFGLGQLNRTEAWMVRQPDELDYRDAADGQARDGDDFGELK